MRLGIYNFYLELKQEKTATDIELQSSPVDNSWFLFELVDAWYHDKSILVWSLWLDDQTID